MANQNHRSPTSKPSRTTMPNPLNSIILRLSPDQRREKWDYGQELYIYDPRTRKARPYAQFSWKPLLRPDEFRYYLVNPQQRATCPPVRAEVIDSSDQQRVIEAILFVQGIDPARVPDFVAALASAASPFESLASIVAGWLQEYVNEKRIAKVDAVARFTAGMHEASTSREECTQYLASQAQNKLGLRLHCELRLPEEDLTIDPISLPVEVLVADADEELGARLDLRIHPPENDEERDRALQRLVTVERMKDTIKMRTMQWFRTHCSLEDFCYNVPKVRRGLEERLKGYIENELRRKLFSFTVTCTVPFEKDFPIREDYAVTCKVEPGQTEVPVQHKLLLERKDIAQFRRSQIANFEQWIDTMLQRHTRAVFFGKSYVAVIVGFDTIEREIKDRVMAEVEKVGFRVTQLITIPTDEQMQICRDRRLSFDTNALAFKTKDTRVEFKLSVHARVTFDNLERLSLFLRPGDYLREQFKRAAEEAAAEEIRKLAPECLYTKFTDPLDGEHSDGQSATASPEARITENIKRVLKREFDAKTASLTLTVEPTEIIDLYGAIRPAQSHQVDLIVRTRSSSGEPLMFHLDYYIEAIAEGGWPKFEELGRNSQKRDLAEKAKEITDAIGDTLRNALTANLESLPANFLRERFDLVKAIETKAWIEPIERVADRYGLAVKIISCRRDLSEWEQLEQRRKRAEYDDIIRRREAYQADFALMQRDLPPDDPRLEEIRNGISGCDKELEPFRTGHDERFKAMIAELPPAPVKNVLPLPVRE